MSINTTVEHMAMFSITKVENWRNVNFLSKCTRMHETAYQISKFSPSDTPARTPNPGRRTRTPPRVGGPALKQTSG